MDQGAGIDTIELSICDQYTIQGDLFSQAILEGRSVPSPLEDSVANMTKNETLAQRRSRSARLQPCRLAARQA